MTKRPLLPSDYSRHNNPQTPAQCLQHITVLQARAARLQAGKVGTIITAATGALLCALAFFVGDYGPAVFFLLAMPLVIFGVTFYCVLQFQEDETCRNRAETTAYVLEIWRDELAVAQTREASR